MESIIKLYDDLIEKKKIQDYDIIQFDIKKAQVFQLWGDKLKDNLGDQDNQDNKKENKRNYKRQKTKSVKFIYDLLLFDGFETW